VNRVTRGVFNADAKRLLKSRKRQKPPFHSFSRRYRPSDRFLYPKADTHVAAQHEAPTVGYRPIPVIAISLVPMHLVMFDIDGTLVDSDDFDGRLYVEAVKDVLDIQLDDDWSKYRHVTDSGILDEVLAKGMSSEDRFVLQLEVERAFIEKVTAYLDDHNGCLSEIPGAKSFMDELQARPDVSVALATGGWRKTAVLKLHAIGVETESMPMASASDSVSRIEIMKVAEERTRDRGEVTRKTYFGDGPWDKAASSQLGYDFIAIGDGVDHHTAFSDFTNLDGIFDRLGLAR